MTLSYIRPRPQYTSLEEEMSHIVKLRTQLEEKGKSVNSEMGALSKQVKELGDRYQRMEEKDKWFREKIVFLSKKMNTQQQEYQSLTEGSDEVKQKVAELKSGTKKMAEAINSTQDRIEDLQKQLATTIEQERKARKGDLLMVDYCRIACYFEQALCSHVLPEVFNDDGQDTSIHNLLDYINGDSEGTFPLDPNEYDHKKILSEARERWSALCEKLNLPSEWKRRRGGWKVWDHMIPAEIRAMDILRLGRKSILERLKPVGLKFAEENLKSIEDSMSSWEFELVARFVGSLRTNMVKVALSHKYLSLD
jgi:archaellum component FlaC